MSKKLPPVLKIPKVKIEGTYVSRVRNDAFIVVYACDGEAFDGLPYKGNIDHIIAFKKAGIHVGDNFLLSVDDDGEAVFKLVSHRL